MSVTRKWKLQWCSGLNKCQQNFTRQGYMLSFEGKTLLLRETVTMLRRGDVIHRGPASFWCIIHVLLIILAIKKKVLLFDSPSYIFMPPQKCPQKDPQATLYHRPQHTDVAVSASQTSLHHHYADTRCRLQDLSEVMDDWDRERERESERALGNSVLSVGLGDNDGHICMYVY